MGKKKKENNTEEKKEEKKRTRCWATIVYPESAPENWLEILDNLHIPALVSPLHNMDLTKDGELKKEHYHVMFMYEGVKTKEQVQESFAQIGGVGIEDIKCTKAYARYLCHLDDPGKAQYSKDDVLYFSGADYDYTTQGAKDKYTSISEMLDFCMDNKIVSFSSLIIYAKNNRNDWFEVLCDTGALTIMQFLKSYHWENNRDKKINKEG